MKAFAKNNAVAIVLALLAGFASYFSASRAVAERISVLEVKVMDIAELNAKVDILNSNMMVLCTKLDAKCK